MIKSLVCSAFTLTRWWISAVRKLRSSQGCGGLVLKGFFLFCGGCEGSFKLPHLFLSDELPLSEDLKKIGISEEKSENRNEAIFRGKNRNKQQPDNLSGIENKDKSKAGLSLGLSWIVDVKKHVIWQSLLSPLGPHFMRAEAALGVDRRRGRRGTKHGTQLNLDLGPNEEDGAEWVLWQSLQSQISNPGLGQR